MNVVQCVYDEMKKEKRKKNECGAMCVKTKKNNKTSDRQFSNSDFKLFISFNLFNLVKKGVYELFCLQFLLMKLTLLCSTSGT